MGNIGIWLLIMIIINHMKCYNWDGRWLMINDLSIIDG